MKRKGFTLIELLAVIIILAIIAVIALPTVINIITKARKSAFKDSVYGIIKAGELYYAEQLLSEGLENDVEIVFPNRGELQVKGDMPVSGNMIISKNGDIAIAASNTKYCVRKGYQDDDVTIDEDIDNCKTIEIANATMVEDITLDKENVVLNIDVNKSITVNAIISPADATNQKLEWISNNPLIATVENGKVTGLSVGKTTITVRSTDRSGINKTINVEIKKTYKDKVLNGADPELGTNMIPVVISNDGIVKKADITEEWYNYNNKEWANAVTVSSTNRTKYLNAPTGTKIEESDILTYLVWIPRYKYKLWYVEVADGGTEIDTSKVHSIDIVFENSKTAKSNGSTNGTYLTHPAFTFGEKELNGYWVGKFETTGTIDNVTIKPNMISLREQNVSSMFQASRNMQAVNNQYGFNNTVDTHMLKNTEWGAITYLSHSKYGVNI